MFTFVSMRYLFNIFILLQSCFLFTQQIKTDFKDSFDLNADVFVGVDNFDAVYFIKNNTLYKREKGNIFSYTNAQLGDISSVDIKNPLKILVFYADFNTVLFLDNNLNELTDRILLIEEFRQNMAFVANSSNNNLWLYSPDDTILTLWNPITKKTIFNSQPLSLYDKNFKANKINSSYKFITVASNNVILKFNEYGTFLEKYKIDQLSQVQIYVDGFVYLKNNSLYLLRKNVEHLLIILENNMEIKNFYISNDQLYIFDGTKIFIFSFIKK